MVSFQSYALEQAAYKEIKPSLSVSKSSYKYFRNQIKPLYLPKGNSPKVFNQSPFQASHLTR